MTQPLRTTEPSTALVEIDRIASDDALIAALLAEFPNPHYALGYLASFVVRAVRDTPDTDAFNSVRQKIEAGRRIIAERNNA